MPSFLNQDGEYVTSARDKSAPRGDAITEVEDVDVLEKLQQIEEKLESMTDDTPVKTEVTGSVVEEIFEGKISIPPDSLGAIVESTTLIPENVKEFNFLINSFAQHKDWKLRIRYSTGSSTGSNVKRLELNFGPESLKGIESTPEPDFDDRVHILSKLQRVGTRYQCDIINLSSAEDLELEVRTEGVLK